MIKVDYRCRNPFNTRIGQFEEGKHTLVVGVDKDAIFARKDGEFRMSIGKSDRVYSLPFSELQNVKHTVWKNRDGRDVWIIPLAEFKMN